MLDSTTSCPKKEVDLTAVNVLEKWQSTRRRQSRAARGI